MYTYHNFIDTFIILNIRAVQSIQKQYGPPCRCDQPKYNSTISRINIKLSEKQHIKR